MIITYSIYKMLRTPQALYIYDLILYLKLFLFFDFEPALLLLLFNLFIILLYNIVLVLPYIDMNPPWVYVCSPSWTPLPPSFPTHPSGSSQCTSPEHPSLTLKLDWWFVSHTIIYMFQCHSPISSHPRPLPQSLKDCSIHLCLWNLKF